MKLGTVKRSNIKQLDLPVYPVVNKNVYYSMNNDLYFGGKVKYMLLNFESWITVKYEKISLLVRINESSGGIHYVKDSDYDKIHKAELKKFKKLCKSIKDNFSNNHKYEKFFSYYLITSKITKESSKYPLVDEFLGNN